MRALRSFAAPVAVIAALTLTAACGSSGKDSKDDAKSTSSSTPTKTAEAEHKIVVTFDQPDNTVTDSGYLGQYVKTLQPPLSPQAFAASIYEEGALKSIAEGFSKNFAFPIDLAIHVSNQEGSPHYDPTTKTVTLYYDFGLLTADIIKAGNPKMTDEDLGGQWEAVNDFVLIHELGHAFVDVFGIPITGREEDAVDGMATYFFTDYVDGGAKYAFDAANFFHELQNFQGQPDVAQFQDEHSLSVQRAYDIACKVAGSSDENMQEMQQLGILPDSRLQRCPSEYEQNSKSWSTLLKPYLRSSQK